MEAIASPLLAATDPSVERVEGIIHVLQHVNISKVSILDVVMRAGWLSLITSLASQCVLGMRML